MNGVDRKMRIHHLEKTITTLGPNKRFGLWVQGCLHKCKNCMTVESWSLKGGIEVSVDDLYDLIINEEENEGITISGGEPFLQSEELATLLTKIHLTKPDFGVICYTGFTIEALRKKNDENTNKFLNHIDLLIDGKYIAELDDGLSLRGSSNQKVLYLTDKYKSYEKLFATQGRQVEAKYLGDNLRIIGIPSIKIKKIYEIK
jgi:anaerobic ribonucleoside-triphosphate reductase activating protein